MNVFVLIRFQMKPQSKMQGLLWVPKTAFYLEKFKFCFDFNSVLANNKTSNLFEIVRKAPSVNKSLKTIGQ